MGDGVANTEPAPAGRPWRAVAVALALLCVFLWFRRIDSLLEPSTGWVQVLDLVMAFVLPLLAFENMLGGAFRRR